MKKLFVLSMLAFACGNLFASEFKSGDQVIINSPVQEDLYIGAGEIRVEAPVSGDLVIAGGEINISDSILSDLIIGGGDINVNGFVGDDIRIAGGDIVVSENVAGDVIIFGGDLTINSDSIGGDVIMFGGDLTSNSHVGGQVRVYGGDITINGSVAGDFLCNGGELKVGAIIYGMSKLVAGDIDLDEDAAFHNDVEYWTETGDVDFDKAMISGSATFNKDLKKQIDGGSDGMKSFAKIGFVFYLLAFLAGVLLIILLHVLFKNLFARSGAIYQDNLLMNFFMGFIFYFITPIIVVIAFLTVIGIPVGAILMMCYLIILLLTTAGTALILANWINQKWDKNWNTGIMILVAVIILVFLKLINMIPFIGWLLTFILCCAAAGTLVQLILRRRNRNEATLA